jgi:hypothetical protein
MNPRKLLAAYAIIGMVVSLPFTFLHLRANPDDAPITPFQHEFAAGANFLGPWGVVAVRAVNFPNAGLRSFSWTLALGMTSVGGLLVALAFRLKHRLWSFFLIPLWIVFALAWFAVGLRQIADGLL